MCVCVCVCGGGGGGGYVDGLAPICYTKACELVGKRVETGLVGVILQANLCASQACPMLRQLGNGMAG